LDEIRCLIILSKITIWISVLQLFGFAVMGIIHRLGNLYFSIPKEGSSFLGFYDYVGTRYIYKMNRADPPGLLCCSCGLLATRLAAIQPVSVPSNPSRHHPTRITAMEPVSPLEPVSLVVVPVRWAGTIVVGAPPSRGVPNPSSGQWGAEPLS